MSFRDSSMPSPHSMRLPEFPAKDLDDLLRDSGAPAPMGNPDAEQFENDESVNNIEVNNINATLEKLPWEPAVALTASIDPDLELPAHAREPVDDLVDAPWEVPKQQRLPQASAGREPEVEPKVSEKRKGTSQKVVKGRKIGKKVDQACLRCRESKQRCDGERPCLRCTKGRRICTYIAGCRQLQKQAAEAAKRSPNTTQQHSPVQTAPAVNSSSRPRFRRLAKRPEPQAPASAGLAAGFEGIWQHPGLNLYFGSTTAGAEAGAQHIEELDCRYGGLVAGARGGNNGQEPGSNFGIWDRSDWDVGVLDAGSHGGHQYAQQAPLDSRGYTSWLRESFPSPEENCVPLQGSAGPSNWTSPDTRRPSTASNAVSTWSDGTLPTDPGGGFLMDNMPQADAANDVHAYQRYRW